MGIQTICLLVHTTDHRTAKCCCLGCQVPSESTIYLCAFLKQYFPILSQWAHKVLHWLNTTGGSCDLISYFGCLLALVSFSLPEYFMATPVPLWVKALPGVRWWDFKHRTLRLRDSAARGCNWRRKRKREGEKKGQKEGERQGEKRRGRKRKR